MSKTTRLVLRPPEGFRFPVEVMVAWILNAFPGSRVVHDNSFEAERERYREHYKNWSEQGVIDNSLSLGIDLIVRSSFGKEQRSGPGKDILISTTESGVIQGRVWASSVMFFTDLPVDNDAVQRLGSYLRSLQFGEPDIYTKDNST